MKVKLPPKDDLLLSKNSIEGVAVSLESEGLIEINIALVHLLTSCSKEIEYLTNHIDDLTIASLSTRNIFELYLILLTISTNDTKLKCWFGQAHRDI